MAILVVFSLSFLRVCPIHFHFLRLIVVATSSWPHLRPKDAKNLAVVFYSQKTEPCKAEILSVARFPTHIGVLISR